MKTIKPKKNRTIAELRNPVGCPTKYNPQFHPAWAKSLATLGAIDETIASKMNISVPTLIAWKKKYPEFLKALSEGKASIDEQVESALFRRAMGYDYDEVTEKPKIIKRNNRPVEVMAVAEVKHLQKAPEVLAQMFWLKNRKAENWRDKQEVEHSGNLSYKVIPDDILEEETGEEE